MPSEACSFLIHWSVGGMLLFPLLGLLLSVVPGKRGTTYPVILALLCGPLAIAFIAGFHFERWGASWFD